MSREIEIGGVVVTHEDAVPHLDLRGLQPPQPAVIILTFLDGPDAGDRVVVRLAREPIFLYPELVIRGWDWEFLHVEPDDVRLCLIRKRQDAPR